MRSVITLLIIFFITAFIPVVDASGIEYNMDEVPLFEYNNSTLIETIYGYYGLGGDSLFRGTIMDFQNDYINFDYSMQADLENNSSSIDALGINNSQFTFNKTTIMFNLNYSTSTSVKSIVPFSFVLNKWPETFYSVKPMGLEEINYRGPFVLIGDGKALVFPLLPKPYFYNIIAENDSSTVSIVANSSIEHDNLQIELTFLVLEEVEELFRQKKTFSSKFDLKIEPAIFPISNVTIESENETVSFNFHDLTPTDLLNLTLIGDSVVINGSLFTGYTPYKLDQFLRGINATLKPVSYEEASELNKTDWIYYGELFYRVVPLKEEFVENITVELKGKLDSYHADEFFSTIKIRIEVNESIIMQKYADDNVMLSNLTLNYNDKFVIINYDYMEHAYLLEDEIVLIGKSWLYPFDYYTAMITVTGGELIQEHQRFKSQDSGFNLDVDFENNNIIIKKSRTILPRYVLSILFSLGLGFLLNNYVNTIRPNQITPRKKIELSLSALTILAFALTIAYSDINYIWSVGVIPFFAFILFFSFRIFKRTKNSK